MVDHVQTHSRDVTALPDTRPSKILRQPSIALQFGYLSVFQTTLLLGCILFSGVIGRLVFHAYTPDPFAAYMPIFPGQTLSALSVHPCQDDMDYSNGQLLATSLFCTISLQDGIIQVVHVEVRNNQIIKLTFYLRHFPLEGLVLRWGTPFSEESVSDAVFVHWVTSDYTIVAIIPRFRYADEVQVVTLTIK